jgi:Na+/H+ antiporter NhaC
MLALILGLFVVRGAKMGVEGFSRTLIEGIKSMVLPEILVAGFICLNGELFQSLSSIPNLNC